MAADDIAYHSIDFAFHPASSHPCLYTAITILAVSLITWKNGETVMKINRQATLAAILTITFIAPTTARADLYHYFKKDGTCVERNDESRKAGNFEPQGGWGACPKKTPTFFDSTAAQPTDLNKFPATISTEKPVKK